MTAFARFLGEKVERYIELRHSLGYFQQTSRYIARFRPLRSTHSTRCARHPGDGVGLRPVIQRRRQQPRYSSRRTPPLLRVSRRL